MGIRMTGPSVDLVVFDDHPFRGEAVRHLLSRFQVGGSSQVQSMPFDSVPEVEGGAYLGLYVLGGRALSEGGMRETLTAALARHEGVIPVALCDDLVRDDVETAIEIGLRGLVLSSFRDAVVVAALQFVVAGGTYFGSVRSSVYDPAGPC